MLWNYCNNLYITYIVLKLGESTGMLISVRMLRSTIVSYYLPFRSFYTVYDIELLLHHGFADRWQTYRPFRRHDWYMSDFRQSSARITAKPNNSSCIVCVTLLDCWTEGDIHRFFKREVLFCNVTKPLVV
jgi:hypothetical protein